MEKFIMAVSTSILSVSAAVKSSWRPNNPRQAPSLKHIINPRSYMFIATIVLVVIGSATLQAYALDEERTVALSLDKYGTITAIASADGKPIAYDRTETARIDAGKTWIATIGACWRKVDGKWGLQFICAKSGDEGEAAGLWIKIGDGGRLLEVQECTSPLDDCAKGNGLKPLVYADPNETMVNSKFMTKNHCCWRVVGGVLKCLHAYCS